MTIPTPICVYCKHFTEDWICEAFPNGIPNEIKIGENNHAKPLPGQGNDIVFEPDEDGERDMIKGRIDFIKQWDESDTTKTLVFYNDISIAGKINDYLKGKYSVKTGMETVFGTGTGSIRFEITKP